MFFSTIRLIDHCGNLNWICESNGHSGCLVCVYGMQSRIFAETSQRFPCQLVDMVLGGLMDTFHAV